MWITTSITWGRPDCRDSRPAGWPILSFADTTTTEAAPVCAVFAGRGFLLRGNAIIENTGAPPDCRGSRSLSLPCPLLILHHDSSQDPVDSRLVTRTFGLEPVNHFPIHAQRDSPLPWTVPARLRAPSSSAKNNRSSSTDARSSTTFPGRDLRHFAFLVLAVMT